MNIELIKATYIDDIKYRVVMTVRTKKKSFFTRKVKVVEFKVVGACTVWAFWPSFIQCSTSLQLRLYQLWNKARTLGEIANE